MSEHRGLVNRILPFSNVDGPGNRMAIFLQGCNIHCLYCHNSETINRCIHCGICVPGCPSGALTFEDEKVKFNIKKCIECDQCLRVCPHFSSPRAMEYSVDALYNEIFEYKDFIRGITISGGEPTLQPEFVTELFKRVKPLGLTCFIDTNGVFDFDDIRIQELVEVTDKFMVDIKASGNTALLCEVEFSEHLTNLVKLLAQDKVYEVRTVLIKKYMDMEKTISDVEEILKDYPHVNYRKIKVHPAGFDEKIRKLISENIPE